MEFATGTVKVAEDGARCVAVVSRRYSAANCKLGGCVDSLRSEQL